MSNNNTAQPGGIEQPSVAVSACLLGERVRYDGKEKCVSWIAEVLAREVELVPICPEVAAGMPVPRPPIQLVARPGKALRVLEVDADTDHTDALLAFVHREIEGLDALPIDGYIFKARSPSCGLIDTPKFTSAAKGASIVEVGSGLWAAAICERWPNLPCVDESEVADRAGQADFLRRVHAHFRHCA